MQFARPCTVYSCRAEELDIEPHLLYGSVTFMPLWNIFLLAGQPKHFLRIAYDHDDLGEYSELENASILLGPQCLMLRNGRNSLTYA